MFLIYNYMHMCTEEVSFNIAYLKLEIFKCFAH
jgi:hypothetical protein